MLKETPWWSSGYDSMVPLNGTQIQYLVGELRSCKLCGAARFFKKLKKRTKKIMLNISSYNWVSLSWFDFGKKASNIFALKYYATSPMTQKQRMCLQCRRCRSHGLEPRVGRSFGGRQCNPFQYSCLENPMDTGAWLAIVHRVPKSQTLLKHQSNSTIINYRHSVIH